MEINALTLATSDMSRAIAFWQVIGLTLTYGGPNSKLTTLAFGRNFINLQLDPSAPTDRPPFGWGRAVLHVESPDDLWAKFAAAGYPSLTDPADAPWGERYFHILDPDGHELSFARPL